MPNVTPIEKTESPSPRSCQQQIDPWLAMGLCPQFPFLVLGFVRLALVQFLCMLSRSPWVHMRTSTVVSGRCCFPGVIHSLVLLRCLTSPLLQKSLWLKEECVIKTKISPSVHCLTVDLCCSPLRCCFSLKGEHLCFCEFFCYLLNDIFFVIMHWMSVLIQ